MKVVISCDAERDLNDGIAFYDQNGTEIGDYFRRSLLADLEALTVLGGIHSKRFGCHCMPAKHFPFAIYYSMSESTSRQCLLSPYWTSGEIRIGSIHG